jgi:S-DNA-T family DNA segregation ATPase FtsK/SpoIIIE
MARAEIAAAAGDETGGSRFASPALRAAFARSGAQLAGILCALLGLAMLVALLSHDPADPSGSTATARAATNLAGPTGAAVSDTLLQAFGLAAFLPAITLLAWAWRLFTERGVTLLPARLMAVADVYDALISRRVYKEPFPHERAMSMIEAGSGSHFDPAVVSAFLIEIETFRAIAQRFQDD